jgi:hypothetical protein
MRSTRVVVVSDSTSRLGSRWSHARSASSAAMAVQRAQTARGSVRRRTALAAASTSWTRFDPAGAPAAPSHRPIAAVSAPISPEGTSSPVSGALRSSAGP